MEKLIKEKLPLHVAIIMDGNGRWDQQRGLRRIQGHIAGAETFVAIVRAAQNLGLRYLTLYTFSEENWQRPRAEIQGLMRLLNRYLKSQLNDMLKNGIRLIALGDLERLPRKTHQLLLETMNKTAHNQKMALCLALSYGGRQEIMRACRRVAEECLAGRLRPEQLDEAAFSRYLYFPGLPDPDLLIRTGGESRISNFLLWQIAYTEIYITSTHWPDFDENELKHALLDYQKRQRRFGKTGEQIERELGE
ncbi:MAG: isoprenyl transferase [Pseudomonadota bacterium]